MSTIKSIAWNTEELAKQYEYTSSGHWFDKDTMRFFRTKLTSNYVRFNDEMAAFVTTEQGPSPTCKRKATIRTARLVQNVRESDQRPITKVVIHTHGEFNSMSLAQAKYKLEKLTVGECFPTEFKRLEKRMG